MGFNLPKMELWESPALAHDLLHLSSLWSVLLCVAASPQTCSGLFPWEEIGVIDSEARVPQFTSWF